MGERRGNEEGGGEEHVPKGGEAVVNSGVEGEEGQLREHSARREREM